MFINVEVLNADDERRTVALNVRHVVSIAPTGYDGISWVQMENNDTFRVAMETLALSDRMAMVAKAAKL